MLAGLLAIGLICGAPPRAHAEDWYTLTPETAQVTFSMVEQWPGSARIWLRFVGTEGAPAEDTRVLVDITCDPASAVVVEALRFDSSGAEVGRRVIDNEPLGFAEPQVARAACDYLPAPIATRRLAADATTGRMTQLLRSDSSPADKSRALEIILSEPGAFQPMIFASVANALLDLGRREEAFAWFAFGHVRLTTDFRAATLADPAYEGLSRLYPMYRFSGSFELGEAHSALTEIEWREMLRRAVARDTEIPRLYPLDVWLPQGANDIAWGAPGSPHPGSDFIIRAQLEAARRELIQSIEQGP